MFVLDVTKNLIKMSSSESMTSGSQNVYVIQFKFSEEWEHLERTAVFATDVGSYGPIASEVYNQLLDEENRCFIPWEVNEIADKEVFVGVFGTMNGNVVLPTVWMNIGSVLLGVTTGISIKPPTPTIYEQILGQLNSIRNAVKNIETGTSLEVMESVMINNANTFIELGLPRSVEMLDSSIYVDSAYGGTSVTLPFISDVIYVEKSDNTLLITNLKGTTYAFSYNNQGFFTSMKLVEEKIDPDEFMAGGTVLLHNYQTSEPLAGTSYYATANEFIGKKEVVGSNVTMLGWNDDENLYRATAYISNEEDGTYVFELLDDVLQVGSSGGVSSEDFNQNEFDVAEEVVSLKTPVRGVFTEEEFNALSEAEKSKGLYIVITSDTAGDGSAILPEGEDGQILVYENGELVAQTISNDILPVVDIEHGGTGESTAADAIRKLGEGSIRFIAGVGTDYTKWRVFTFYDESTSTFNGGSFQIGELMKSFIGTNRFIAASATDYTTLRARAISLHQTMPSSDLINGAIYGIY